MTVGKPSGNQITFFIFATWLLAVPLTRVVERSFNAGPVAGEWLERGLHIVLVAAGLLAIAPLRKLSVDALRVPLGDSDRFDVAFATGLSILATFGFAGSYALWWIALDGPLALEQRLSALGGAQKVLGEALQPTAIATQVVMASIVVPVVEELVFRRFLFRAWAERHGWVVGMVLSSVVFGLLHPFFFSAFMASIVFTCVYQRTGSLRASIIVHGVHNLLVFYPILGRFIVPLDLEYPGDLASWTWHLVALAASVILLPVYAWLSRDRPMESDERELDHVALPR